MLADALEYNEVLRTLDLRSNAILRGGTEALARALGTNRRLTALDLADNKLRPEDGEVIGKALPQNAHLHELGLDHNLLGAPGAHSLAIGLRESSLRSLDLGFCLLGPAALSFLCPALAKNRTLTALRLSGNKLRAEDLACYVPAAISLADALRVNDTHPGSFLCP